MFELRCDCQRQSFFMYQNYDIYESFKTAPIQHDMAKVQQGTVPALRQDKFDNKCTILILGYVCFRAPTNDDMTRHLKDLLNDPLYIHIFVNYVKCAKITFMHIAHR